MEFGLSVLLEDDLWIGRDFRSRTKLGGLKGRTGRDRVET